MSSGPAIVRADIASVIGQDLPWERLSGATVAVTGATGFIGSYLVRTLLSLHPAGVVGRPVRVLGMARDQAKVAARFPDYTSDPNLQWVLCDLSRPHELELTADWILHAASPATPRLYGSDPVGTLAPNVMGTWRLLELASRSAAKGFLFFSTSEVYGDSTGRTLLREEDYGPLDPARVRSAYAESKRMGETLAVAWMHQYGLPIYIVRPFHTYGPGVDLADGRVFADFVADVVARRDIRMSSDGSARRAFCYISDAVAGVFHVLLKGEAGRPYNIANPAGTLSIRQLAEMLATEFTDRGVRVAMEVKDRPPGYMASTNEQLVPSIDRATALGWSPSVAPPEGFRRMVESYA